MSIQSYKLGPGELTLGEGATDFSLQVTACKVVPTENVTTTEAIPVLGGEELPAEDIASYVYALEVTFLQDLAAAGIVDFTWTNKGAEVPFVFVPSTAAGRQVSGVCRIVPLTIGGDEMKRRPTSSAVFRCIGEPDFGAAA